MAKKKIEGGWNVEDYKNFEFSVPKTSGEMREYKLTISLEGKDTITINLTDTIKTLLQEKEREARMWEEQFMIMSEQFLKVAKKYGLKNPKK